MSAAECHQVFGTQGSIGPSQLTKKRAAGKEGKDPQGVRPAVFIGHLATGLTVESPAQSWHGKSWVDACEMFERLGLEGKVFRRLLKGGDFYHQRRAVGGGEPMILLSLAAQWVPFAGEAVCLLETACNQLQGQPRRPNAVEQ